MNVCVLGLWHLGLGDGRVPGRAPGTTSIGLRSRRRPRSPGCSAGKPPLFEPGLDGSRRAAGLAAGALRFTHDARRRGRAAPTSSGSPSTRRSTTTIAPTWTSSSSSVAAAFPHLRTARSCCVSSQVPVGTTRAPRASVRAQVARAARVSFACSPENLRLGKAIEVFTQPDRVVVGVRDDADARR